MLADVFFHSAVLHLPPFQITIQCILPLEEDVWASLSGMLAVINEKARKYIDNRTETAIHVTMGSLARQSCVIHINHDTVGKGSAIDGKRRPAIRQLLKIPIQVSTHEIQFSSFLLTVCLIPHTIQDAAGKRVCLLYEKYMRLISRKDLNAKFKLQDNVNKEDPVDVAAYHVTRKLRALQDDMRRQYRLANPKPPLPPTAQPEDVEITFMIEEVQDPVVSVC